MRAVVEARALGKAFDMTAPWIERVLSRSGRRVLQAVDGVSFSIERGRTLALVGESGCGKSTVARLMAGLLAPDAGSAWIDGVDVQLALTEPGRARALRRRMQMVFQDPYASLDPRWRVRDLVAEPIIEHEHLAREEVTTRVVGLLESVGLGAEDLRKYPHQFSSGQRQRLSIARALATQPAFLVCDEPTSALDVSVQAQVLNLMVDLQHQRGFTCLFISHNLAVVRYVADTVGVMYLGRLVEIAPKATLFAAPSHPYTRMLLAAVPDLRMSGRPRMPVLGEVPDPLAPPGGCAFHPRCPHANDRCRVQRPSLMEFHGIRVACHAMEEGRLDA